MSSSSRIGTQAPHLPSGGSAPQHTNRAATSSTPASVTPGGLTAHGAHAGAHGKTTAPRASNASLKNFLSSASQGLQQAPERLNLAADGLQQASALAQQAGTLLQAAPQALQGAGSAFKTAASTLQNAGAAAQLVAGRIAPIAGAVVSAVELAQAASSTVQAFRSVSPDGTPVEPPPGARSSALLNLAVKTGEFAANAHPALQIATAAVKATGTGRS
ncbi:hypothetical protein M8A51_18415 [Schlegelella sp. S2-27]|uniref:Uncharacterized protein n=1 Tax=Caldimonas mangrovi TaxID=2944811 RepID=A0ABT0YS00_9BURK|nr:hypothetical protein [Caldimonas mangrovi]MCM5681505.1 hypothetical protein [Caldimonas mangrovi]